MNPWPSDGLPDFIAAFVGCNFMCISETSAHEPMAYVGLLDFIDAFVGCNSCIFLMSAHDTWLILLGDELMAIVMLGSMLNCVHVANITSSPTVVST